MVTSAAVIANLSVAVREGSVQSQAVAIWPGLRELVPVTNAIVGIDLADCKRVVVVNDHDSKVAARRMFR